MSTLNEAIEHLEAGDWQAAHSIVQSDSSELGSWAHGIVHLLEGDRRNAGYWYANAQRPLPEDDAIGSEIAALKEAAEQTGQSEQSE